MKILRDILVGSLATAELAAERFPDGVAADAVPNLRAALDEYIEIEAVVRAVAGREKGAAANARALVERWDAADV